MPFSMLEATSAVGARLLDYGHVRLFSPWRYNIDPIVMELLLATGWQAPRDGDLPLAREVVERVLRPFSELPDVAPHLTLNTQVISIAREGIDKVKTAVSTEAPFVIQVRQGATITEYRASAVIDATGTWMNPIYAGIQWPRSARRTGSQVIDLVWSA